MAAAAPAPLTAQAADPTPMRSVLDGVYTAAQAERGEAVFKESCGLCHGTFEFSGSGFFRSWEGTTIQQLYELIRTTMPFDSPGALEPGEYADILAYFLKLNGYPAGEAELKGAADALKRIRVERKPPGEDPGEEGGE